MENIIVKTYNSKFGDLILGVYDNKLCLCDWVYRKMRKNIDKRIQEHIGSPYEDGNHELIDLTIFQLEEYFDRKRKQFALPLLFIGTPFQTSVWEYLLKIPYGKTDTYLNLSRKLENESAIRAVASANGANAISIIVPCHRIIGSEGDMVGYAGGVSVKVKLLGLETSKLQLSLFD
jgi:methylated-DNA-[protein]-cysteine S-methyltransferase